MLNHVTTRKSKVCFGYTNKASNGFYLPFFDYDDKKLHDIEIELTKIQKKYALSDIYIFSSKNGYNALSLDKLPYNKLKDIYSECKLVCDEYLELGLRRNILTLRIGKDKKLIEVVESNNNIWKKSLSHAILLIVFFDVDIEVYANKTFDNNLYLRLKAYRSEKHGFLNVEELENEKTKKI